MAVLPSIIAAARADAILMCPPVGTIVTALLDIIVARAACMIQPDAWKKKQQPGLALLICHYGTKQIEATSGSGVAAAGPVTSVSIGGKLSVGFAGPSVSTEDIGFGSTEWGIQYLQMKDSLMIPPLAGRC